MDDLIHWRIIVTGRVQGVAYRYSAAEKARELGVAGSVRNMEDGSVHLEVEGSRGDVLEFYNWCRKGPPLARILEVKTVELPLEELRAFRIIH